MLWIKALHVIFVVTWFSGLFYLPRLFVYHAMAQDAISIERFKVMERKLYYGIAWPGGVFTTFFGLWLLLNNWAAYLQLPWMQLKLFLVGLLWVYHGFCGHYRRKFKKGINAHSSTFYRWFNEAPAVILVAVVILVIVRPGL